MKCPYCRNIAIFSAIGIIIATGAMYFINPNIIYYFDVQECKSLISNKMKDPDSIRLLEYIVERKGKLNDELANPDFNPSDFSGKIKESYLSISGRYKATNSYGSFVQGSFVCDTMGGKMTGLLFE